MIFLAVIYFSSNGCQESTRGNREEKMLQGDFVLSVFTKYLIDAACNHVKNPQHGNCDQQISDAPGQVGDPVGIVLWTENLQYSCQKCRKTCNVHAKNAEKIAKFMPKMQKNLQCSCQKCRKICNIHAKNAEKFWFFDVLFHKIKSYLSLMEPEFYTFSILNTSGFI